MKSKSTLLFFLLLTSQITPSIGLRDAFGFCIGLDIILAFVAITVGHGVMVDAL